MEDKFYIFLLGAKMQNLLETGTQNNTHRDRCGVRNSMNGEILSRLNDSTDLARCRLVSNTFNSASSEVRSLTLTCSMSRYLKSRSPETNHLITPFKIVFNNLVLRSPNLESVTICVDRSLVEMPFDDFEDDHSRLASFAFQFD